MRLDHSPITRGGEATLDASAPPIGEDSLRDDLERLRDEGIVDCS